MAEKKKKQLPLDDFVRKVMDKDAENLVEEALGDLKLEDPTPTPLTRENGKKYNHYDKCEEDIRKFTKPNYGST